MTLPRDHFKALNRALLSATGSEEQLTLLLRSECDMQLDRMTGRGKSIDAQTLDVIQYCERKGCVEQLVEGLLTFTPRNPDVAFLRTFNWSAPGTSSDREAPSSLQARPLSVPAPWGSPVQSAQEPIATRRLAYADVYGLVAGITCYEEVASRLGKPTALRYYNGKPVAEYADYGLHITFNGDTATNPRINMIRVTAAAASDLPFGLHCDMARAQWSAALRRVYGPGQDDQDDSTVIYKPPPGSQGHLLTLRLERDKIVDIIICMPLGSG